MLGDWTIVFEFNQQRMRQDTPLETQWRLDELKDGFWLNAERRIVREDRGVFWVPSGRIMHIEKRQ